MDVLLIFFKQEKSKEYLILFGIIDKAFFNRISNNVFC